MALGARPPVRATCGRLGTMSTHLLLCALVALLLGACSTAALKPSVTKNCVRLVGDTGPKGRLEISTKDSTYTRTNGGTKNVWLPVCSEGGFNDALAQVMCDVLGYKYGRLYFNPAVAYPSKTSYTTESAAMLTCTPNQATARGGHRRLLGSDVTTHTTASSAFDGENDRSSLSILQGEGAVEEARNPRHDRGRSLSVYYSYNITFPRNVPYTCTFIPTAKCAGGPYAGIECSKEPLPPAPSPPPSPPAPPPYETTIRLIGGRDFEGTEPNLCVSESAQLCPRFGRVEMLVNPTEGDPFWAPVCGIDGNNALRARLAYVACHQAYGWPAYQFFPRPIPISVVPSSAPYAFAVPSGQVTSEPDFNPAAYRGWAVISAMETENPTSFQAGNVTVVETPCSELLAVRCEFMV